MPPRMASEALHNKKRMLSRLYCGTVLVSTALSGARPNFLQTDDAVVSGGRHFRRELGTCTGAPELPIEEGANDFCVALDVHLRIDEFLGYEAVEQCDHHLGHSGDV